MSCMLRKKSFFMGVTLVLILCTILVFYLRYMKLTAKSEETGGSADLAPVIYIDDSIQYRLHKSENAVEQIALERLKNRASNEMKEKSCAGKYHVDTTGGCFLDSYHAHLKANITKKRHRFLLWEYLDLSEPLLQWSEGQLLDILRKHSRLTQISRWAQIIILRMEYMEELLLQSKDARFAVEKDKCQTMQMLHHLQLPHASVRRKWNHPDSVYSKSSRIWSSLSTRDDTRNLCNYSNDALETYLKQPDTPYPAILKVGHMHQQKSTLWLPDRQAVLRDMADYIYFVEDKMSRPWSDNAPWARVTNSLYAAIDRCVFVQDVVNPTKIKASKAERPWEMMVEVMWGEPAHGVLVMDVQGDLTIDCRKHGEFCTHVDTEEFIVLKNGWAAFKWQTTDRLALRQRVRTDAKEHHLHNHVCTNRTLLSAEDPLGAYVHLGTPWGSLYLDNASSHTETTANGDDIGHHRRSNVPEMACSEVTFFKMADPARGNAGMAEVCDLKYTGRTREACRYEYREIQALFWRKYSGMMRGLASAWDVCAALGTGIGADYVRCDVFILPSGAVHINEISLSSNWGNALPQLWQQRVLDLWLRGYGADIGTDPHDPLSPGGDVYAAIRYNNTNHTARTPNKCLPTSGNSCGPAYSGTFDANLADLPSPMYVPPLT
eukprot:m.845875 g.845875  ORF g.845875 m.845875 type:complete len:661 (-) comp23477_c1_seq58:2272-4254(-)